MELEKPTPKISAKFVWRLFRQVLPYKRRFILLFGLSLLASLLHLLPPLLLQYAIDHYILQKNLIGMILILLALIGLGGCIALQRFFERRLSQYIGLNVVRNLRDNLFEHISHLPFEYFDQNTTGDVVARVTSDTDQLTHFLNDTFINFVINIGMLIGMLIIMFLWDYRFGLIFLGILPLILVAMKWFMVKVTPINRRTRKINSALTASIQECFNGIREVKLYGREEFMQQTLHKWNNEYVDSVNIANKYNASLFQFVPMILNIFSVFSIILGCLFIIDGHITIGQLVAAIMYFGLVGGPIFAISGYASLYNAAKAAAERIFEIIDRLPSISDDPNAIPLENVKGVIEFNGVSFEYSQKTKILQKMSFKTLPGELIALVGPSGVGKTTLVHLIPRFYDATEGIVSIDGINVKQYRLNTLRKNVGIVMQNVFLFDGTIGENIAYGKPEATQEEIERAAKIAQLDEFIKNLPAQYNTPIGERGVRLSGGQAQRVSIARVLLVDPKILILDEPTANIDAITDQKVMQAVESVMKGRTTLVIAHCLWTIKNADRIILLKDGVMEASGNHQNLLQSSKFYKEFFASQFQLEEKEGLNP